MRTIAATACPQQRFHTASTRSGPLADASLGGHADFGEPIPQVARCRNDLRACLAVRLFGGAHPIDHQILRFRRAIERSQARSQRLERVLLTQVEESILRALDRQRSLQAKNGLLVTPGCSECIAQARQRSEDALALESRRAADR